MRAGKLMRGERTYMSNEKIIIVELAPNVLRQFYYLVGDAVVGVAQGEDDDLLLLA